MSRPVEYKPTYTNAGLSRIDSPNYLAYLLARFRKNGGKTIESGHLGSIDEAIQLFTAESQLSSDAIVNFTGLGSRELVGDDKVFPTRGQTVLVRYVSSPRPFRLY